MVGSITSLARLSSMPHFRVDGQQPLRGQIRLSGAKNAASKILLATILSSETSVIDNIPILGETTVAEEIIGHLGGQIERRGHLWSVGTPDIRQHVVPTLSRKNRLPILTLGP